MYSRIKKSLPVCVAVDSSLQVVRKHAGVAGYGGNARMSMSCAIVD